MGGATELSVCDYFAEPEMLWAEGKGEKNDEDCANRNHHHGFSAPAVAQTAAPKVDGKLLKQTKPLAPMGCKLVGMVRGTKIWAGDCAAAPELRGPTRGRRASDDPRCRVRQAIVPRRP